MRHEMIPILGLPFELRVNGGLSLLRMLRIDKTEKETDEFVVREFYKRYGADGVCAFLQRLDEGFCGQRTVDFKQFAPLELEGLVDEQIGEPIQPFVTHIGSSLCILYPIL